MLQEICGAREVENNRPHLSDDMQTRALVSLCWIICGSRGASVSLPTRRWIPVDPDTDWQFFQFCISEWRNNLDKRIRWTVNLNIFCHIKQKLITQCNKILLLFLLHILIFSFKQLSQHCASGPVRFRYQNHLLLIKDCVLSWNTFYKLNIVETLSQKIIFLQCLMSKLYLNLLSHSIHITNYCFSCV